MTKHEVGDTPKAVNKRRKRPTYTEAHFEPINTWWDEPLRRKDDPQWKYLEHSGLMFYPPYKPHGVPMLYEGREIHLPPPAEEVANFWCAAQNSDYPNKPRFVANFWAAFLGSLPDDHPLRTGAFSDDEPLKATRGSKRRKTAAQNLGKFENANFDRIREYLEMVKDAEKQARKNMDKTQREQDRLDRLKTDGPYMYALHDGIREKVALYKTEVPGLFRGRGEHPKMGRLKRRIFPDEVSLNLSEDAPVPRLPPWMKGHSWQDVFHDNSVTWLAFYRDTVNSSFKYVFLGASSAVKGMKDYLKYELARRLKESIDAIRQDYTAKMQSSDLCEKQLGTAAYVIDALALRVGNEKDREEEADTVGCCSLRREHITAMDDNNHTITLDFLGKDSIRYLNTVTLNPLAYKNVKSFCKNKKPSSSIFDNVSTGILNKYLRDLMPGLSAKVFRTYNASITLQKELNAIEDPNSDVDMTNIEDAKRFYEHCNRQVAILCNHQRTVPKQHNVSMEKLQKQYKWLEEDLEEIRAYIQHIRASPGEVETFAWDGASERDAEDPPRVSVVKANMKEEAACRKLKHLEDKQVTLGLRIRVKDENKAVSNNTSKQHYMDPRITVTFCKKFDLPIEKFFNSTLLKKFPWAMYAKSDFVW